MLYGQAGTHVWKMAADVWAWSLTHRELPSICQDGPVDELQGRARGAWQNCRVSLALVNSQSKTQFYTSFS